MSFQFLCPQGHLLEGEEHEQGQAAQCPHCGSLFVIPAPAGGTTPPSARGAPPADWSEFPAGQASPTQSGWQPPQAELPHVVAQGPQVVQGIPDELPAGNVPAVSSQQPAGGTVPPIEPAGGIASVEALEFYHIPCPNGHDLETPRDMLGEEAMCPFCHAKFVLRMENSREYRQHKAAEEAYRQQRIGKFWLQWSIAAAVVVALAVVILIVLAASQ